MDAAAVEAVFQTLSAAGLEVLIRRANREYWDHDAPTLPDPLYDRIVERLRRLDPEAEVLSSMGPSAGDGPKLSTDEALRMRPEERFGATVIHQRPMLSLDKCYNEADLKSWAGKISGDFVVMPKMDGIACSLRYDANGALVLAATRGSGTEGEDITANVLRVADVPGQIKVDDGVEVEVRGELYMRLSNFALYKGEYAHPRNLTAGSVKQKDPAKSRAAHLSFFPYDVIGPALVDEGAKFAFLAAVGFRVEGFEIVPAADLQACFERFVKNRPTLDYEIDGVVYRAALTSEQRRMGETGHHPRYAIAYKFQGDAGHTDLVDVLWSVSRTGTITPVAILDPIELSGAMIGRASLHNVSRFEELGLTHNCKVELTRRGGVIPQVESVVEAGPGEHRFELPTACPACGGPVERRKKRDGEFLWCKDPKSCVQARLRELEHFAKVVDIQGFGPKVVALAVDAGLLSTPVDYYRLRMIDLAGLERLGERSAQNLVDQVEAHRTIPLPVFLQAIGVEHLGKQNAILLSRHFGTLAAIRAASRDDLMAIKGVKDAIADAIVDGLKERAPLIDALLQYVTLVEGDEAVPDLPSADGELSGKSFLFTGTLTACTRERAQARVRELGGETPSGASSALSFLVVGGDELASGKKSSKIKRAEALIAKGAALKIISEADFLEMVGGVGEA
ncbi:MAG: NAD-dependent DNA ligase LigA [Myxococcales bacterium]|nr:NAD-dependent DNA ligase LigA [Myxococcales bacterium]